MAEISSGLNNNCIGLWNFMNTNFRHAARLALARAKELLAQDDDYSATYAALNLRMAMEAIIYDKAGAYKKELPQDTYKTWQPKKILQALLEIDPKADKVISLSFGIEENYGVPAKEMISLGTDTPLTLAALKKHYDAIGSYLHTPTIKQIEDGKTADAAKLRQRCADIVAILEAALKSTFFNSTIGQFSDSECRRCGEVIHKRVDRSSNQDVTATCIHCGAQHHIAFIDGIDAWTPILIDVPCGHKSCEGITRLFKDEVAEGERFRCDACAQISQIGYGVKALSAEEIADAETS